jgi:hypothetical protein
MMGADRSEPKTAQIRGYPAHAPEISDNPACSMLSKAVDEASAHVFILIIAMSIYSLTDIWQI